MLTPAGTVAVAGGGVEHDVGTSPSSRSTAPPPFCAASPYDAAETAGDAAAAGKVLDGGDQRVTDSLARPHRGRRRCGPPHPVSSVSGSGTIGEPTEPPPAIGAVCRHGSARRWHPGANARTARASDQYGHSGTRPAEAAQQPARARWSADLEGEVLGEPRQLGELAQRCWPRRPSRRGRSAR